MGKALQQRKRLLWVLSWRPDGENGRYDGSVEDRREWLEFDTEMSLAEVLAWVDERLKRPRARCGGFEVDIEGHGAYNYGFVVANYSTAEDLKRDLALALERGRVAAQLDDKLATFRAELLTELGLDLSDRAIYWSDTSLV
jgi:hypothetical protein